MNYEQIEAIAAVLHKSPTLTEIEIRNGEGISLRLRRPAPKPARQTKTVSNASPQVIRGETTSASPPSQETSGPLITPATATVVGVFRALVGDAEIVVGKAVNAGQVIGHIEAMRLLNDCLAPEAGTIASLHVEEGQPVEYGQLLFEIAPPL